MDIAEKLTITMSPDMIRDLRASVSAGEYVSTSEALRDAVRLWQQKRRDNGEILNGIRARVRHSLDDPRPNLTLEEVDAQIATLVAKAEQAQQNEAS